VSYSDSYADSGDALALDAADVAGDAEDVDDEAAGTVRADGRVEG
jgi:hypothetical protein